MSLILSGTDGLSDVDGSAATPAIRGTDANTGMFFPAADTIAFTEGGVEAMRIDSSGNVGIGTSSPSTQLQMNSSAATYSDQLRVRNTNFGNADIGVGSGIMAIATDMANITFYTSSNLGTTGSSVPSNERMRIDSSGNVGVGITDSNPLGNGGTFRNILLGNGAGYGAFQAISTATATGSTLGAFAGGTTGASGSKTAGSINIELDGTSTTNATGRIVFYTGTGGSTTERMRITSGGIVRINNTSDATFSAQLNTQFTTSKNCGIYLKVTDTNSSQSMILFGNTTSDAVGGISTSGSATSYATSSDYRLKENIAPMTGALATVSQLKPCTYTWKVDGSAGQGFIAHELQAVVPDCVTGEKDAVETYTDEDGNEQTRIKPQGIDTSFLVATLTAAIQELKAELDATKAEVAALKAAP